ncbi:hypothetical protein RHGRI_020824 [Rhododendron griersonianum]|uniref:Uncharacterized protein n=1 Tax=Rhododendron griersonianum TaxID=479676 RepID=A0AAV6JHY9_9ERIC|nr:hypothetical protein RHGRI_020824 [Rhododendron griersonianum]
MDWWQLSRERPDSQIGQVLLAVICKWRSDRLSGILIRPSGMCSLATSMFGLCWNSQIISV